MFRFDADKPVHFCDRQHADKYALVRSLYHTSAAARHRAPDHADWEVVSGGVVSPHFGCQFAGEMGSLSHHGQSQVGQ